MLSVERALTIVIGLAILACPCTAVEFGGIEFAGGTGEPNNPFLIATAEQLLQAPFGGIGLHWRLCCDIDLAGIRTRSDRLPFPLERLEGHFDGAGHGILHARIVGPGIIGRTGLFSEIGSEGTVINLTLRDIDIGGFDWSDCVGALAGKNCGTVANCGAEAWIVGNYAGVVGGLVGVNEGSIANCRFDGWVSSDWEYSLFAITYLSVGGLVGLNKGTISGCYATGIVAGATGVGGLVGRNWAGDGWSGSIRDCYAMAWVRAEVGGGGLVGDNLSSLAYCYAAGTIEGSMRGGLVGMARWSDSGTSIGCLWAGAENCQGSGAGTGLDSLAMKRAWVYAGNGWAGNPNWILDDSNDYPYLAWEGTKGSPILETEPPTPWPFPGRGEPQDPYLISTPEDFRLLATLSDLWDKHFMLVSDLDFQGLEFRWPSVCAGSAFTGTFDGNGHVIRNVLVKDPRRPIGAGSRFTLWNLGVFGCVAGEIRNLVVENIEFVCGPGSRRVGLLVGTLEGRIENCRAQGRITVGESSEYIGALVGFSSGEIIDCEATAEIKAGEDSAHVGGLVGWQPE